MTLQSVISDDIAGDILAMQPESVPELVAKLRERRELSVVVHELNQHLWAADKVARASAHAALMRLGFI